MAGSALGRVPSFLLAPFGLIAGFVVARTTKRRELGGALFALVGVLVTKRWSRAGTVPAVGLGALYVAAMGGSHPLAKRIGAWPAVAAVATVTGLASFLVVERSTRA